MAKKYEYHTKNEKSYHSDSSQKEILKNFEKMGYKNWGERGLHLPPPLNPSMVFNYFWPNTNHLHSNERYKVVKSCRKRTN